MSGFNDKSSPIEETDILSSHQEDQCDTHEPVVTRKHEHDDSDDDSEEEQGMIQLGFLHKEHNPLFAASDWRDWDGGKVGGKPVWLDPVNLPSKEELLCFNCKEPMTFLLQIYCPMDVVPEAFHRSIYVFCCKKKACIATKRAVKSFRVQLPKINNYYSADPKMNSDFKKISNMPKLCALCGCRADNICSGCKYVAYCSKAHQKLHWKAHKVYCKSGDVSHMVEQDGHYDESQLTFLYPEYEMTVEEEENDEDESHKEEGNEDGVASEESVPESGSGEKQQSKTAKGSLSVKTPSTTKIWEDALTEGGEDEAADAALTQADYNNALSEQKYDPVYVSFLTRLTKGGTQQVLRYCEGSIHNEPHEHRDELPVSLRDKGRLFMNQIAKKNAPTDVVPPCSRCNAPRALEFQIMPQILHYLGVDKNTELIKTIEEKKQEENGEASSTENPTANVTVKGIVRNNGEEDIEWGTIDVYTCSRNCCKETYCEEAIIMQDIPIEELQIPQLNKKPSSSKA